MPTTVVVVLGNSETLSDWRVCGDHVDVVGIETVDPELGPELLRLKRALGLEPARRTVGRFRLIEQIGKGGMGIVYAAEDPELERRIALKLVQPRHKGSRARLQARLQREARALGRLSHENVVRVYDVGSDGDELFIAMELVDGPTLLEWQWQIERSVAELLDVYLEAAAGLAAAHDAGLVHRDFKPENVFVTGHGRVLVGDFGLANLDDSISTVDGELESGLTEAGSVLGTLGYMAPEQLSGDDVDARADQFAFCVALWEAITGARPFPGKNAEQMLEAIEAGEPRFAERVPRRLRTILRRGLAFERERRFRDLRELLGAIAATRSRRPWLIAAVTASAIVMAVTTAMVVREKPKSCVERERINHLWGEGRTKLADRLSRASAQVLEGRAEDAVEHLRRAADSICEEPNDARQRVLNRAVGEFGSALADPEALELEGWVALIESLESLDLDRPAIDPEVAAAIDRSRMHEWSGDTQLAWEAAEKAVALAQAVAPSGWSASHSEALIQHGRMQRDRLAFEAAIDDFIIAGAHAEGSGYMADVLRARLGEAEVLVKSVRDPKRAEAALVRLEPLLERHSWPASAERAAVHELRSLLAALRGEPGPCIAHAGLATLVHLLVRPDPVAMARTYATLGVGLSQLGIGDPRAFYARSAELLHNELPADNRMRLTLEYDQALRDIESADPARRDKGREILERLHREGDRQHRVLADRALLYLALGDDDLEAIRALVDELEPDAENAEDPHLLIGTARLGELDRRTLAKVRAHQLELGRVSELSDLEYELAVALGLASCDLARVGLARLDEIEAGRAREQSQSDFERLLISLDCN